MTKLPNGKAIQVASAARDTNFSNFTTTTHIVWWKEGGFTAQRHSCAKIPHTARPCTRTSMH